MAAALLDGDISAHGASGRTLEYALVASLGLHLALFVVFPALHFATLEPPIQPPLVARLEPAQPAPAAMPQAIVAAQPEPKKPPAKPVVHRPPAKPLARARPERNAPPPPAPAPQELAPAVAEAVPVASPTAPAPASQPIASIAPQPAAPAAMVKQASEAMLAQYRLAVIEAARRYKRYPPVARDNNWQGRAEVHMAIGADGTIAALSVRSSSGHEILDHEALDMIRRATPKTPIPASLRGTAFTVDIPVVFSLEAPES
jgi:periplasmic protein TonB